MTRPPSGLLAAALALAACAQRGGAGEDPGARLAGRLDLARPGAVEAVAGTLRVLRDPWLTGWYGREASPAAPPVLGDERPALRVDAPSRLRVALPAAEAPRRLLTAARRVRPERGAPPLRAEIFWEEAGGTPRALGHALLAAEDDQWRDLAAELPATAGTLWFIARADGIGRAEAAAGEVSWAAPTVAPSAAPALPDLILLTVDTLRGDAMAGMPATRSRFAQALWSDAALAPSNWTLPSFASLWTGLDAGAHGAGRGAFRSVPAEGAEARGFTALGPHPSFPEALHAAGWATAGIHQNPFLEDWTGLSRGFERWVRTRDEPGALAEPALAWWRANQHRPRFLVLHWMTPHLPYGAEGADDPLRALPWRDFLAGDHPPEERARFFALDEAGRDAVRALYAAEVAALDAALDALLGELLASARAPVLLFWSDHGEELWDEGSFEHGHSFADAVVRVPIGLRWPTAEAPTPLPPGAPAGHLGLHLLHLLADSDPRIAAAFRATAHDLPPCGLTPSCPAGGRGARSSHPLYRAAHGGVRIRADGAVEWLPFDPTGSGGEAPALSAELARRLAELGYAGR